MTAKIIGVVHQKGGAGKSTVSMLLGGVLAERGKRVLVVDADPQGTASRWAASAPDDQPFPATVVSLAAAGAKLHREIRPHIENYDVIIVDCPPSLDSPAPASVLLVCDLALVPVGLSPADLWATRGVKSLVDRTQNINEHLRPYLLPNRVQRTAIGAQVREVLESLAIPVLASSLGMRVAYQEASAAGGTVRALGHYAKVAQDEVATLATEIETLLGAV